MKSRDYENVPDGALELYERRDELRKFVINLELTVHFYNRIRRTVLEVEYPLVEDQLIDIDKKLSHAENSLTWNSPGTTLNLRICINSLRFSLLAALARSSLVTLAPTLVHPHHLVTNNVPFDMFHLVSGTSYSHHP